MVAVSQSGTFNVQEFTDTGALMAGGRLYTYTQGTTTKKVAYTDAAGSTPHTYTSDGLGGEYIALNARGELPAPLYLTSGAYDLALKTAVGATVWTRRADPVGDTALNLAASSGSSLVGFIQAGTGAVARTLQDKEREDVSITDFGAVGDGTTDNATAIQACATYCYTNGKSMLIPDGVFKTGSKITWVGKPMIRGNSTGSSFITVSSTSIPAFEFQVSTTTVEGWMLKDFSVVGPLTSNTSSTAFRWTGDSTALVQYGYCNCYVYGFGSAAKDEKTSRTTGFGQESMLNWNRWEWSIENQGKAGYWGTQGSGTGNLWFGGATVNGSGVPVLLFEGNGCVVGDIIASGQWGNQVAGGVGVEVGASTVYRAQINLSLVQFDANCDVPLKLSGTGATAYTNVTMQANNYGGNAALGGGLQPLRNSVIQDRDVSDWSAGKFMQTSATGAQVTSVFDIDFATFGGANVRIFASGPVGGVGTGVAAAEFDIRESGGSLTVTSITNRLTGPANAAAITVTTSGTKATVKLNYTPSSTGTGVNATVHASGDNFKITRL